MLLYFSFPNKKKEEKRNNNTIKLHNTHGRAHLSHRPHLHLISITTCPLLLRLIITHQLPIASCLYCHLNTTIDTYPQKCMCIHTCMHTHHSSWHHTKSKYPFDHIFHHFIFENFIYDSDILIWSLWYFSLSNSSLQSTILKMHVVFITTLVEEVFV